MERIVALSNAEYVEVNDIPLETTSRNIVKNSLKDAQMDFERRYIKNVLTETDGNQTKAAQALGINRTTLIAKIKQLGLK